MSKHPIVHIEFSAKDWQAASQFYATAFGWKVEGMPEMNYATFETGDGPGGGFAPVDGQMTKPGDVLVYIETPDIEASLKTIESLGGKALVHKTEIPSIGWFGVFQDPTGNRIGLYTDIQAK